MKILMLIPPQPIGISARWFLREERHAASDSTPTPPYLGPSVMGMVRQKLPEAQYRVIDCMVEGWRGGRIREEVERWSPNLIISVVCGNHMGEADERLCAELPYPTICIVTPIGACIEDAVRLWMIQTECFVVTDEVEVSTAKAAKEFFDTGDIVNTKGLVLQRNRTLIETGFPSYSDMSRYPLPAFDLFPFDKYNMIQDEYTKGRPEYKDSAIINGMKGCPFHCNFCIVGGEESKSRVKTGLQIFEEMKYLYENYGKRRFNFLDSEFAANKKTAKDFCRLVINSGMQIKYDVKNRIEFLDEELLELMRDSGCERVFYGIETADPILQAAINKNLDLEKAKKAIRVTKKYGLKVYLYMIVGIMGETRESLQMSAEFVADSQPYGISWGILFPEIGSPWYDSLRDSGKLLERDWQYYRKLDRLTFFHDVYGSMDEIKREFLWMRTRYRWLLARDSNLPRRVRVSYFVRCVVGQGFYYFWDILPKGSWFENLRIKVGLKFDSILSRFARQSVL